MTEPALAVDFGTCFSAAALVADGRCELLKEPASGDASWPSAVLLDGDTLLVGTLAEQRKRSRPGNYRAEFKRALGDCAAIPVAGRSFQPGELVAAVLAAMKQAAESLLGTAVPRAVLTFPASYLAGDPRRARMVGAGEAAGFADVDLLAEPVAAALAPVVGQPFPTGATILVYDLGGGTFDAALVRLGDAGRHEILGHGSLDDCGGRDVDALLYREIVDTGGDEVRTLLNLGAGRSATAIRRARLELAALARDLKHQLATVAVAEDVFVLADLLVALDRTRLAALATPLLERTARCCENMLDRAGVSLDTVDAILLVGGSTRMPLVADVLTARLGRPLRRARDPDLAVVTGAATWLAATGAQTTAASRPAPGREPLRWDIPGGRATVVRWLTTLGEPFTAGTPLARIRLADGTLHTLTADKPGALACIHAPAGTPVDSTAWLATTGPLGRPGDGGTQAHAGHRAFTVEKLHPDPPLLRTLNGHANGVHRIV